jgi:hypothetical protein
MVTTHERGKLTQVAVLPAAARFLKIGGPHYRGYVEKDGDQANGFNGVNLESAAPPRSTDSKQPGLWRTELEPTMPGERHQFLNVLLPRLLDDSRALPTIANLEAGETADAVRVGSTLIVFARGAQPLDQVRLSGGQMDRCLMMDARRGAVYRVNGQAVTASGEGVLAFDWPRGAKTVEVTIGARRGGAK